MKKIINPFAHAAGTEEYNCFGCSPANEFGLQLNFWLDDEDLVAKWYPKKDFEGWTGVLHGGIQAALMDEAAAWLVFVQLKTSGVTARLNTTYIKPVYISRGEISIRAKLIAFDEPRAHIECTLADGEGQICATATTEYFCYPEKIAKAKFRYPGKEAFIPK